MERKIKNWTDAKKLDWTLKKEGIRRWLHEKHQAHVDPLFLAFKDSSILLLLSLFSYWQWVSLPPLSSPFKTMVNGSRLPVKPAGCKSATVRRTAAMLLSCKSVARPARRQPLLPAAGTAVRSQTAQLGWWRGWRRRPGFPGPPWTSGLWSARRLRRWSRPRLCQERHWRRWSRWRCQWRRRHTGPGWQRPCWRMCLDETDKNVTILSLRQIRYHILKQLLASIRKHENYAGNKLTVNLRSKHDKQCKATNTEVSFIICINVTWCKRYKKMLDENIIGSLFFMFILCDDRLVIICNANGTLCNIV